MMMDWILIYTEYNNLARKLVVLKAVQINWWCGETDVGGLIIVGVLIIDGVQRIGVRWKLKRDKELVKDAIKIISMSINSNYCILTYILKWN